MPVPPVLADLLARLPHGGWGIDDDTAGALALLFDTVAPAVILEFGSGTSTVVFAALADAAGSGARIVSLEESEAYAGHTRALLAGFGLERRATVIAAPVVRQQCGDWQGFLYRPPPFALDRALAGQRADLIFIDGPASWLKRRGDCRFGTLLMAQPLAAHRALVVADDCLRHRDLEIFKRWAGLPCFSALGIVPVGHGLGLGELRGARSEAPPRPAVLTTAD
jgi:predicted O-methyltransferase YrrM